MQMSKIGASCKPFNCVNLHSRTQTIGNVTKNTLETTLSLLCWTIKTAVSSLAVKRNFSALAKKPQKRDFSKQLVLPALRNRTENLGGEFGHGRREVWRA